MQFTDEADMKPEAVKKLAKLITSKTTIVLIHALWCGHCREFVPHQWAEFKKICGKAIHVVEIESSVLDAVKSNKALASKLLPKGHGVYFPMMIVFTSKGDKRVKKVIPPGTRDPEDIKNFIKKLSEAKAATAPAGAAKSKSLHMVNLRAEIDRMIHEHLSKHT
jgi:thiol-disulfide isomerase/thioredoxin